ncbi:MAG: TraR/DksA C4-type zinc finger protein [Gemmataceae bacterium]|nr:TraR/DksA C4-type zinc finger protein [Gemmataceae bacterium]
MRTPRDIEFWHSKLLALRSRIEADLAQVRDEAFRSTGGERAGGISNTPIHPADLAGQEYDEAVSIGLVENESLLRREIEDALDRLRAGSFGFCEECGRAIPKGRLNVVPYTRYCVTCAEGAEKSRF